MQSFMAVTRLVAQTTSLWFLVSLLSISIYGQTLEEKDYVLRDADAKLFIEGNAGRDFFLSRDFKVQLTQLFDQKQKLARSAGLFPGTVPNYPVAPLSHLPVSSVLWPVPSMVPNTPVLPPATAPRATYRSKFGTKQLIAGLVGAGLTGLGAYLVARAEEPGPIWEVCTLCSEPPTSHARVHATGTQVAGVVSILGGIAFLISALGP